MNQTFIQRLGEIGFHRLKYALPEQNGRRRVKLEPTDISTADHFSACPLSTKTGLKNEVHPSFHIVTIEHPTSLVVINIKGAENIEVSTI